MVAAQVRVHRHDRIVDVEDQQNMLGTILRDVIFNRSGRVGKVLGRLQFRGPSGEIAAQKKREEKERSDPGATGGIQRTRTHGCRIRVGGLSRLDYRSRIITANPNFYPYSRYGGSVPT